MKIQKKDYILILVSGHKKVRRFIMKLKKKDRQDKLLQVIEENPFITDEELAKLFQVSIQTIRLDRLGKNIPEARERIKKVASQTLTGSVKSLQIDEVIGEILDISMNETGLSLLEIENEHVFSRNQIARGHHLFAQANSLCVAVIDAPIVVTKRANVQYVQPVFLGQRVIAKAQVKMLDHEKDHSIIEVKSSVGSEIVFLGEFEMVKHIGTERKNRNYV